MATDYSGGMFHPTVVPENFDPEEGDDGDGDRDADASGDRDGDDGIR